MSSANRDRATSRRSRRCWQWLRRVFPFPHVGQELIEFLRRRERELCEKACQVTLWIETVALALAISE